ncbi:MAG TPA: efflux RND transporter periplasmic adaptor subunit [Terriglobales bacterium]|nr:efflux RND transporter periplasmic adaptor subunit [Terriglobales bacterium]
MPLDHAIAFARKHRASVIVLAVALGVLLLAAFISARRGRVPVRAEKALRRTILNTISTNGKIQPVDGFEAHAPLATTVRRVLVREGDWVKKGQLLLQLDDADAAAQAARALAQLRSAEAALHAVQVGGTHEEVLDRQAELVKAQGEVEAAQRNLDAMRQLKQNGAATAAEVQNAENRLKTAQAQLSVLEQKKSDRYSRPEVAKVQAQAADARAAYAAAQEVVRQSNVTATSDGTVYNLPVHPGMYVAAGDLLVQVADLSTVQVAAYVDEPDIGRLERGQKVTLAWDAIPGRTWAGTVTRVPTTVSLLGTRTVGQITCEIPNPDHKLLPNVNVSVTITTARHDHALTVPREAVHQEDGQHYVFQVVDGELQRREVETSVADLTRIEVVRGLEDDAVVALGSTNGQVLRSGLPVRVVQR